MLKAPLVSVLMPAFNASPHLSESVGSILSQTFSDIELIVVDDGSTDATTERLNSIHDPRLKILRCSHQGIPATLNAALAEARGEYVARMDADDRALPHRLEKQVALMEKGGVDVVSGLVRIFRDNEPVMEGFSKYENWVNSLVRHEDILTDIFVEDPIPSPTLFMRRNRLLELGGWDPNVYPDDYNLTLKNFKSGLVFAKVAEVILEWRDHDNRFSRTSPLLKNQRFFDLKARTFAALNPNGIRSVVIWGLGSNAKQLFRAMEAANISIVGFTTDISYIKESKLYDRPVKAAQEWDNAFFVLATAARNGRQEAEAALSGLKYNPVSDYLAFC